MGYSRTGIKSSVGIAGKEDAFWIVIRYLLTLFYEILNVKVVMIVNFFEISAETQDSLRIGLILIWKVIIHMLYIPGQERLYLVELV